MINYLIIFIIIILLFNLYNNNIEHYIPIWNIGTRFYPVYDIRGYIYPYPYLYFSPYYYTADGKYKKNINY